VWISIHAKYKSTHNMQHNFMTRCNQANHSSYYNALQFTYSYTILHDSTASEVLNFMLAHSYCSSISTAYWRQCCEHDTSVIGLLDSRERAYTASLLRRPGIRMIASPISCPLPRLMCRQAPLIIPVLVISVGTVVADGCDETIWQRGSIQWLIWLILFCQRIL
jgi:hypothetical protein